MNMNLFSWFVPTEQPHTNAIPLYIELIEAERFDMAFPLLKKLAARNDALAMTCLGSLYAMGKGCTKDPVEAAVWFRQAANGGNINAQTALGCCLATGNGVPMDLSEAAYWLYRGGKGGSLVAVEVLGKLAFDNPSIIGEHFTDAELAMLVVESRRKAFAKMGREYPSGEMLH